ncbi:transposase [Escherichia coli cloneA_i1]|nr:hypothetical protein [Escherichia coli]EHG00081.1 transposase [Escherichia coli cloneA_i1]
MKQDKRRGLTRIALALALAGDNSPMERFFRSLKNEWVPATGYVLGRQR